MLRKNDYDFHISPPISAYHTPNYLFISFLSMYKIVMFKAKWDHQIKVYIYFSKNSIRDIISKTVEKNAIIHNQPYVANFLDKTTNVFQASITNNEKSAILKLFIAYRTLPLGTPLPSLNCHFYLSISYLDILRFPKSKYSHGGGARRPIRPREYNRNNSFTRLFGTYEWCRASFVGTK